MKRLKALGLVALLATAKISMAECIELGVKEQDQKYQGYGIHSTGNYCITADVSVNETWRLNHGWNRIYKRPAALGVNASDVEIDLQKHTMTSKASNAINALAINIVSNQKNILIKNGTLSVKGEQAIGVYNSNTSLLIKTPAENNKIRWCRLSYPECEEVSYLNSIDKLPPNTKTPISPLII